MRQQKHITRLLEMIAKNPELEIIPMVNRDCVFDDEFVYWLSNWGKSEVEEYCFLNERVCLKDTDFDGLVEEWVDDNFEDYPNLSYGEIEKLAEAEVDNYDWTEAIIVYIEQG